MEDSPVVRDEVRKLARGVPGVGDVRAVGTVASARTELADRPFGFWLLDFKLPDGTALDLLELRDGDAEMPRAVAVISNFATRLVRERCLQAGADHFLDKTSDMDALPDLIGAALEGAERGCT